MTLIARILRYLFWVLIASWTLSILRRIVGNMAGGAKSAHPDIDRRKDDVARKLVRDPVCGMHIAEGLAIPLGEGKEILHFCSTECRGKYLEKTHKFAANA
jgi:YHS domain-containing protein